MVIPWMDGAVDAAPVAASAVAAAAAGRPGSGGAAATDVWRRRERGRRSFHQRGRQTNQRPITSHCASRNLVNGTLSENFFGMLIKIDMANGSLRKWSRITRVFDVL